MLNNTRNSTSMKFTSRLRHTFLRQDTNPWPIIERFLKNLPDGSVGLDIGCGNGKYLPVNPNIFIVGSDSSRNLVFIADRHQPHSVVVSNILDLPHPLSSFDFAISIAVVHHLSTPERRINAIRSILETLKQTSRALIFVWALEQENSRRGWTETDEQDVMVPWVMRASKKGANTQSTNGESDQREDKVFHRYYHLYSKGELERDIINAGGNRTGCRIREGQLVGYSDEADLIRLTCSGFYLAWHSCSFIAPHSSRPSIDSTTWNVFIHLRRVACSQILSLPQRTFAIVGGIVAG